MTDNIQILCWVDGAPRDEIFVVEAKPNYYLPMLKKAIHDAKPLFRHVFTADSLKVWKVNIPLTNFKDKNYDINKNNNFQEHNKLQIWEKVSDHWPDGSLIGALNAVVHIPQKVSRRRDNSSESRDLGSDPVTKRQRLIDARTAALENGKNARAPSSAARCGELSAEQKIYPVYNGRPWELRGPPISIYHPVFAKFMDDIKDPKFRASPMELQNTHTLLMKSAKIYVSDQEREDAIRPILSKLLNDALASSRHPDQTNADLSVTVKASHGKFVIAIKILATEMKNEIGTGGSDPAIQGGCIMRKAWVQQATKPISDLTCCPSFILSIAGPCLMILGSVLVDMFIVEPLTDYIFLGGSYVQSRVSHTAKVFRALAIGIKTLSAFYTGIAGLHISNDSTTVAQHLLPHMTTFTGPMSPIRYLNRLLPIQEYPERAIFQAERVLDGHPLVVKFIESIRYAENAHKLLAEQGLAPRLHYCASVSGGLVMVVMDLVDGEDAHARYISHNQRLPDSVLNDVKRAVDIFHANNFVFGDLRAVNIMVVKDPEKMEGPTSRGMLIDFDWCGEDGISTYPSVLNDTGDIEWHSDTVRGGVMRREHDLHMLKKMAN